MADIIYDTLTIQINADSKVATKNINALNRGLKNLDNTAKELDREKIEEVKGLLLDIANIDFSNVSKGLQDVVSAFKSFQSKAFQKMGGGASLSGTRQSKIPTYEGTQLPDFNAFPQGDLAGFQKFVDGLKESSVIAKELNHEVSQLGGFIVSALTPTEQLGKAFGDLGLNGKQIEAIFKSINYETDSFNPEQLEQIKQILITIGGYSGEQAVEIISRLKEELKNTENGTKKAHRSFTKMFLNIMKYRVVRKIIQSIFKAFQQGIEHIVSFDSATSEAFNEIKGSLGYIIDSLGSMLAPLIQMLAPVISAVADVVGGLANSLGQVFAEMNGQTQFAQAKKDVDKYNESLKKTQSIGIDELNVLSQDQQSGSFEYVDLENSNTAMKDMFGTLADVVKELMVLIEPLANIIKEIFEGLAPALEKLLPLITIIVDIVALILELLSPIVELIMTAINNIIEFLAPILKVILQFVKAIIEFVKPFIEFIINSITFIVNLVGAIVDIFTGNFDKLGERFKALGENMKNILRGIGNFFVNIFNTIIRVVEEVINTLTGSNIVEFFTGGKVSYDIHLPRIPQFALGGFPREDGLFYANHNELIGSFDDGRTAVANNEQITDGIYRAVKEAMSGGNQINIELDGYDLTKVITRRQKNVVSSMRGGNLEYGK